MARRRTAAPRRRRARKKTTNVALKNAAAAIAGGVGGSVVLGAMLVRSGASPVATSIGVMVGGGVGAATMKGMPQFASGGAAAAGAGQLALAWLAKREEASPTATGFPLPRQAMLDQGDSIDVAFEKARRQLALDDDVELYEGFEEASDEVVEEQD